MAQNVQVILARDVANLGRLGELVAVRPGYARNFLIPQGLAMPASPNRLAQFSHQKKVIEHKRRLLRAESEKRAKEMAGVTVTLTAKVGEQNKLFGSIGARDISKALAAMGQDIHHKDIKLEEPIKAVGTFTIDVRLEADVSSQIKVIIVGEIDPEIEARAAAAAEEAAILRKAEPAADEGDEAATDDAPAGEATADDSES
jgi:large subunit ribosomal protein L9